MICTWLNSDEFERFSRCDDEDVNEVLQQVREINPVWYVDQRTHYRERWFRKPIAETSFTLYEVYYNNGICSHPEVIIQMSANTKPLLLNFLYGLNVGYHFDKAII